MGNKFKALLGDWRSFAVIPEEAKKTDLTTPDGLFRIKKITDAGKIVDAEHELKKGRKKEVYGQVISAGSSFAVVMEHESFTSAKKVSRYIGYVVFDEQDQMIIIGRKGSYDLDKRKGTKAGRGGAVIAAAEAGQDDGTVIITKP
jgi:hypothetical protein